MRELNEDTGTSTGGPGLVRRFLPLIVLAAIAGIVIFNGWHRYLSLEFVAKNRDVLQEYVSANYLAAILAYMGIYVAAVALSLPGGALLTITGGFLFGLVVGGPATVVAATTGATVLFLIAKSSLGETLSAKAGPFLDKLASGFRENALSYLLFLRLVPAFPFWLVNLAPALLGVRLSTYVTGTFLGIIPGTFVFASLGSGLDRIIEDQQKEHQTCLADKAAGQADLECVFSINPGKLLNVEIIAAFVGLGLVALVPIAIKKFRARRAGGAT